uniref:Uncharacterized protein n=1 Tax=Avena sativa TaxID=4498 RepID=A0ACD5VG71_AVESA
MNPKILDAGIPPPNTDGQCVAVPDNIRRYAPPEWVRTGRASTKSDMFSFGLILLELLAGRGMYYDWCNGNRSTDDGLSYVWKKWNKGSIADIADASLGYGGYPRNEMQNYVHVGLLCVQEDRKLRPDASEVMEALDTCPALLPTPSTPYLWQSKY